MPSSTDDSVVKPRADYVELSIAVVFGLALALTTMFLCVVPIAGNLASARDFVVFWATGQQLIHHANPYDPAAMALIEHTAGLNPRYGVLYMRNPPWALPLVMPLGLVGLRVGALLWSLVLLACLVVSVWQIQLIYDRPGNRLYWLALSFAPALLCLWMGQTALFALLGLVLFLRLHRNRPFMAGLSLWLCVLKPHLFLPFAAVLLVWIVVSKSYKVLGGAAVAIASTSALAFLLDPSGWKDYSNMMRGPAIERQFVPCLSVAMRLNISPQAIWLQYLPAALACVWALAWFWPRRHAWDWTTDGSLLMLVSIVAAPYCWLYDQALAIPALMQAAYLARSRPLLAILALANLPIEIALMCGIRVTSALYLWTAPAWLAWYLFARASVSNARTGQPSGSEALSVHAG